ncbi:MAG: hypothetical protein ACOYYS_23095 [Chloroflexota bacterium]
MRLWFSRFLIGTVFLFNVQCAVSFWWSPQRYAPAYELAGEVGNATLRGFAVLFLMWNVPYAIAFWHPVKNRLSLWEAVIMQGIGVIGETALVSLLPAGHDVLRTSLNRFITFDGFGFILLLIAAGCCGFPVRKRL